MGGGPQTGTNAEPQPQEAADGKGGTDDAETTTCGKEPAPGTPVEIGGPKGAEPTRFGDWERNGRCIDF